MTWRRRRSLCLRRARRCARSASGPCPPARCTWRGRTAGPAGGVVRGARRRGARHQLRGPPDPPGRPGRDRARPHHGALPGAVRRRHARLPPHGPPRRGRRAPGCTRPRGSWPTRWWHEFGADPARAGRLPRCAPRRSPSRTRIPRPARRRRQHDRRRVAAGDVALRAGRGDGRAPQGLSRPGARLRPRRAVRTPTWPW